MDKLFTTVGGGLALVGVALFLKWKKPQWTATRALLMLGGGIAAIGIVEKVLTTFVASSGNDAFLQKALQWGADRAAHVPAVGDALHGILGGIAEGLTWIVAVVLVVWMVHDMFPRVGNLRRRGGGGGMSAGGGGGRLAALHEAQPHTMWVALLVPAAVALVPPLAHLLKIGG